MLQIQQGMETLRATAPSLINTFNTTVRPPASETTVPANPTTVLPDLSCIEVPGSNSCPEDNCPTTTASGSTPGTNTPSTPPRPPNRAYPNEPIPNTIRFENLPHSRWHGGGDAFSEVISLK